MERTLETLSGDTEGVAYQIPVYRFRGSDPKAPAAYLQAALHAGELPGTVALHSLMPELRRAEDEGRLRGDVTVLPWANPVGRAQYQFGSPQGRFHVGSRTNFNRDFPLLDAPDAALPENPRGIDARLKAKLLELSLGHDIVLDLHCDDEGVDYLYVPAELWPAMADCAAAMDVKAVVLWSGSSGGAFEEASIHPYLRQDAGTLARRVVTTVEYRGLADVGYATARSDAEGLYRLLVARGVIEDPRLTAPGPFRGLAAPIENVETIAMPRAGAILFDVVPGERVGPGDRLATIVFAPGEESGSVEILAPQAGYILTRSSRRAGRMGDDIIKLIGEHRSASAKQGALES